MKPAIWAYIAYAFVWISSALAISVAIYMTKSATPLWALLIPALVNITLAKEN